MSRDPVPFSHPWEEALIKEVADVVVGGTPSTAIPAFWGGQIKWMASGDVHLRKVFDVPGRITELGLRHSNAVMVEPMAVAMALAGQGKTRGTVALTFIPVCTNQSIALIRTRGDQLDPVFLFQSLIPRYEEMRSRSAGGGRAGLTKGIIERIPVQLPPPPEQRKIAVILTTVDNLIERTEALIAKYQALKQGLMHDLFTRGARGQLRPSQVDTPGLYKESALGWIPKEWEAKELGKIVKLLVAGVSVNSTDFPASADQKGILKTSCLNGGKFNPSENKTIVPNEVSRACVNPVRGAIIISRMNTPQLVGENAYVADNWTNLFLPDRLWMTVFYDDAETDSVWLSHLLQFKSVREKISGMATGTSGSMKNISKSELMRLALPVPLPGEQNKIAERINAVVNCIRTETAALEKFRIQKSGLMQDLLTGKVRVTVTEDRERK